MLDVERTSQESQSDGSAVRSFKRAYRSLRAGFSPTHLPIDSYLFNAPHYHVRRMWAAGTAAVGMSLMAWSSVENAGVWLVAAVAFLVLVHSIWRFTNPGVSAVDTLVVDTGMVLAIVAVFHPPAGFIALSLLFIVIPTFLFMKASVAPWMATAAVFSVATAEWGFASNALSGLTGWSSLTLAVAGLPLMAWLVALTSDALTGQRRLVSELGRTAHRFQKLFTDSRVPMFRTSLGGALLDGNNALVELFRAGGIDFFRTEPATDRYIDSERRIELIKRLLVDREVKGFEAEFVRFDGSAFWGRLSATLADTADGLVLEGIIEDVTEVKESESRDRLARAAREQVASAVVIADAERRVMTWNSRAEEMFGCSAEDALGRPMSDLLKGVVPETAVEVRSILDSEGRWHGETEVVGPNGVPITCAVSGTRVVDDAGVPSGFAMVFTDMTEIQEARRTLSFQASLLSQVHNAVIATDIHGKVIYWNPSAERMYGWTEEEAMGTSITELTVPEGRVDQAKAILHDLPQSDTWEGEFEVARKGGSTFRALVTNVVLRDTDGEPVGVLGVSSDLSSLKAAENEAVRLGRLARSVLNSVRFPVALISDDGSILDVNEEWVRFGRENGADMDGIGIGVNYLAVTEASVVDEPEVGHIVEGIRRVLEGSIGSYTYEYPCHSPSEKRWFRMEASEVPGIGAVIAHWDTTSEHQRREMLEKAVKEKDRFLAAVSHELRTPLTAILGFSEHLRSGGFAADEAIEYQNLIANQARELSDLVEDLLLVGRLSTDTITVKPEQIRPIDVVSSVVRPWTMDHGYDIEVEAFDQEAMVYADPLRFRQIVRNLVTNAAHHGDMPIKVRLLRQTSVIVVEVIDSGFGVPEGTADDLFEPYSRASTLSRQSNSVGLGLHVSAQLAERMGGSLEYKRVNGKTVFSLTLPRVLTADLLGKRRVGT